MRYLAPFLFVFPVSCAGAFPVDEIALANARARTEHTELIDALKAIESWHFRNDIGLERHLNPGASESDMVAEIQLANVRPNKELQLLWSWHNGGSDDQPLIWYHDFLSAEESAKEYLSLLRNPLARWDRRFLAVFSFQGEWYAVYCGSDAEEAGPVVHDFVEDEPEIAFTNLTTMLVTMAEIFESGAVSLGCLSC